MTEHPREQRDDPLAPDPDVDRWSAWLPDLGEGDTASSPTQPIGQATAPLPLLPPPPPPAAPGPALPAPALPAPALPAPALPAPPLPQAVAPGRRDAAPAPPASRSPWPAYTLAPVTGRPSSHLALAILALIVAPIPFGIVAVVKAASVWSHWSAGRNDEARRASRSARTWAVVGLAIVAAVFVGMPILGMLLFSFTGP